MGAMKRKMEAENKQGEADRLFLNENESSTVWISDDESSETHGTTGLTSPYKMVEDTGFRKGCEQFRWSTEDAKRLKWNKEHAISSEAWTLQDEIRFQARLKKSNADKAHTLDLRIALEQQFSDAEFGTRATSDPYEFARCPPDVE